MPLYSYKNNFWLRLVCSFRSLSFPRARTGKVYTCGEADHPKLLISLLGATWKVLLVSPSPFTELSHEEHRKCQYLLVCRSWTVTLHRYLEADTVINPYGSHVWKRKACKQTRFVLVEDLYCQEQVTGTQTNSVKVQHDGTQILRDTVVLDQSEGWASCDPGELIARAAFCSSRALH